jgi:hypothetical protein
MRWRSGTPLEGLPEVFIFFTIGLTLDFLSDEAECWWRWLCDLEGFPLATATNA